MHSSSYFVLHKNVKYVPGHKIPEDVVAVPDVVKPDRAADIPMFVVPRQLIRRTRNTVLGKIKPLGFFSRKLSHEGRR